MRRAKRKSDYTKLELKLVRQMGRTCKEFGLIEDGDRILVAMSGGKDSYALLVLLDMLRRRAPVDFELIPWHLDQVQPGYDGAPLRDWFASEGWDNAVIQQENTYAIVTDHIPEGKTYCSLCSRLRRGILYNAAVGLGCNRIALGHHADDTIETAMLNMMFAGQLKAMPPWLRSDDGRNNIIRPLMRSWESDLIAFSDERQFPILPCNLCGTQENLQRQAIKAMLTGLQERYPRVKESMLAALTNVRGSHLLDTDLWQKLGLGPGTVDPTPRGANRLRIAEGSAL
ncbi:MAG: tRNA 2-thiocytidine(32) synthetase TtcA [Deltaproteobacteria bacterium]|nr:tRNA 2-thiocytidine(32) synthetase TtcA [Deltaproteobacteria bacterium]